MANLRSVEGRDGHPSIRPNGHDWKRAEAALKKEGGLVPPEWSSFPIDAPDQHAATLKCLLIKQTPSYRPLR
jgi:hypothetical protein